MVFKKKMYSTLVQGGRAMLDDINFQLKLENFEISKISRDMGGIEILDLLFVCLNQSPRKVYTFHEKEKLKISP